MLQVINVSAPQPGTGKTVPTVKTHVHKVTITNTETGVTYEEMSGPPEPLTGESEATLKQHRHSTTAGYLSSPIQPGGGA